MHIDMQLHEGLLQSKNTTHRPPHVQSRRFKNIRNFANLANKSTHSAEAEQAAG